MREPTHYPSLANRLVFTAIAGVIGAVLLPLGAIFYLVVAQSSAEIVSEELHERIDRVQAGLALSPAGVSVQLEQQLADSYDAMTKDSAYVVRDSAGSVVAHSPPGEALQLLLSSSDPNASSPELDSIGLQRARRTIDHNGVSFTIDAALSSRMVNAFRAYAGSLYLESAVFTTSLAIAVFSLLVYLTTTRMLRPLVRASEKVEMIGPRHLAGRVPLEGMPKEMVPLITALNDALDRLEQGYKVQREFLGAAAHELKTPLALLQAEVQLSDMPNKALVLQDIQLMGRQVHQLLHLAEASELHNYELSQISVSEVIGEAVAYMSRVADQKTVYLSILDLARAPSMVVADRGALFVLARNLLENAVHHSPAGSVVSIEVGSGFFSVKDEGPGVASGSELKIFERFWRASDNDSEGAGLGLAICKEICNAHGWSIHLAPAEAGQGARFTVDISSAT